MCNLKKCLFVALSVVIFYSCDRYDFSGFVKPPSDQVEKRFAVAMESNSNPLVDTLITLSSDYYSIAMVSDIHVRDKAENLALFVRTASADASVAAIAFLGDITDRVGGLKIAYDTIVNSIPDNLPWYPVIGNHDLYFNQYETYKELFGSTVYCFTVKCGSCSDLFVCLDSGSGTLGRGQIQWLENLLRQKRRDYRHTVVLTHTNFWDTDFTQFPTGSFSKEETMQLASLFSDYDVEYVVSGHDHTRQQIDFNGVNYLILDAVFDGAKHPSYLKLNFSSVITHEWYPI